MRANVTAAAFALALLSLGGSACAMNSPMGDPGRCQVIGAEKLAPESGGSEAICNAIRAAAAAEGLEQIAVEVRVVSPHMLTAVVTTPEGRRLPEQRLASADRELAKSSFERFARTLVRLAQAHRG